MKRRMDDRGVRPSSSLTTGGLTQEESGGCRRSSLASSNPACSGPQTIHHPALGRFMPRDWRSARVRETEGDWPSAKQSDTRNSPSHATRICHGSCPRRAAAARRQGTALSGGHGCRPPSRRRRILVTRRSHVGQGRKRRKAQLATPGPPLLSSSAETKDPTWLRGALGSRATVEDGATGVYPRLRYEEVRRKRGKEGTRWLEVYKPRV